MTKLDRCWKNCLRMWKWVSENWEPGGSVSDLERQWIEFVFDGDEPEMSCFFCHYAIQISDNCKDCPGRMADASFGCGKASYNWSSKPKAFYRKLLQLDAKRRVRA